MSDQGTSVTLIFYKVGTEWWKEPALNLIAAVAQLSSYTHVELAIGEAPGSGGQMANVARIFNDACGVELTERTGRNPAYTYLSLGCSKASEQRMLSFARAQVGKPFSNMGMARSLLFPRATDNRTYYCAELVAAILKQGGLMYAASQSPCHSHAHTSGVAFLTAFCLVYPSQEPRQQSRSRDAVQFVQTVQQTSRGDRKPLHLAASRQWVKDDERGCGNTRDGARSPACSRDTFAGWRPAGATGQRSTDDRRRRQRAAAIRFAATCIVQTACRATNSVAEAGSHIVTHFSALINCNASVREQ